MKTPWTPGPWEIDIDLDDDGLGTIADLRMATAITRRSVYSSHHVLDASGYVDDLDGGQLEEAIANLRLMAAAPELATALEERLTCSANCDCKARAALAKAHGGADES